MITRQHNNILKAVRDRDPDAAYSAMREHIIFVLDFVHEKKALR
jgi:DNA-binding FadR family transcriptional regulator